MKLRRLLPYGLLLLAAGGAGAVVYLNRAPEPAPLVVALTAADGREGQAIRTEWAAYPSLHPGVSLAEGTEEGADVVLLPETSAAPRWALVVPWEGRPWVLLVNRSLLARVEGAEPALVADWKAGRLDAGGWTKVLAASKAGGFPALTLGNAYGYPLLEWLQVWTAAREGWLAAAEVPASPGAPGADLAAWQASGAFEASAWDLDTMAGLGPVFQGRALAALTEDNPDLTQGPGAPGVDRLPLPRKAGDPAWTVGTYRSWAVAASSRHRAAAEEFVRFLTSEGFTARLSQATGRTYRVWNGGPVDPPVVAAWAARINEEPVRALARSLDPKAKF